VRDLLVAILIATIAYLPFTGLARPMEPILGHAADGCCRLLEAEPKPAPTPSCCATPGASDDDAEKSPCLPDDSGRCAKVCCVVAAASVMTSATLAPPVDDAEPDPLPRPTNQRADSATLAPDPPVPIA